MTAIQPQITSKSMGNGLVITLLAAQLLEEAEIAAMEQSLLQTIKQANNVNVVLNFENVTFLSSAVLRVLIKINTAIGERNGKLKLCYNFLGLKYFFIEGTQKIPSGKRQLRMEFAYDGGGLGKGGVGMIYVNDKKVAEGRIERTQPLIFSADETADVGEDDATPVTEDYTAYDNKFTGKIGKITIDLKETKTAEKAQEDKLRAEAAYKKAMAD